MTRRAFSLPEVMVVAAVTATLFATLFTVWSSARRYSGALEARFDLVSRAQIAITGWSREVQQARRIAHPRHGETTTGMALLDAHGDLVQVLLERPAPGQPGVLVRRRIGAPAVRGAPGPASAPLLTGVLDARFHVPAVPPGRDPDLAHLTLTLAGADGKPVHLIASAGVRAPVPDCPIQR